MQVIAVRFFASDIKPNWISKGDNTTLGGGLKFLFFFLPVFTKCCRRVSLEARLLLLDLSAFPHLS